MARPGLRTMTRARGPGALAVSGVLAAAAAHAQPAPPSARQLDHASWTIRDGAPTGVRAFTQSPDGVLWIGSATGLYRFDGVRFEPFEPPSSQPLASLSISQLLALPDSVLWIGYGVGGVSVLARGGVVSYGTSDGLPEGTVNALARDSAGVIWVATTTGLARLQGSSWQRFGPESGYPGGMTSDLLVDRRGTLWAPNSAGVFVLPRGASRFVRHSPPLDPTGSGAGVPREAPDGSVWGASTTLGLTRLTDSAGRATPVRPEAAGLRMTWGLYVDRRANAWMIADAGLVRVPLATSATRGRLDAEPVSLTTGPHVNAVLEDREGNVWVGTAGGIERFREPKLTPLALPLPMSGPSLAPADDGSVWLASFSQGLLRVGERAVPHPGVPADITSAYRDLDGALWFGGPAGMWHAPAGAARQGTRFTRVALPEEPGAGDVQAIARTLDGDLWVSIRGGRAKGVFRRRGAAWSLAPLPAILSNQLALTAVADSAGRVWLGYVGSRLALVAGNSTRVYSDADGLQVGTVTALLVRGPRLWIGGETGLTMLEGGRFRSVAATEMLRGITGIVETTDGDLWLNGAGGITHIEAAEVRSALQHPAYRAQAERFDYHDGLDGTAPQVRPLPSAIQGTDGRLWFTTETGVVWLDPARIRRNRLAPPVQIRAVNAAGRRYEAGSRVILPARISQVQIAYTALSLAIPDRVRFRYRLAGVDTAWTEAGTRREAYYTNPEPGRYRFQVTAANEDGVWNPDGALLEFEVAPAFYQTFLFRGGLVLLIAGLGGAAAALVQRRRHRQAQAALKHRYEATLAERGRIAQDLHDTLLQGFAGVTLQLKTAELALPEQPDVAAETILRVQQLARASLREARERVWDMRETSLGSDDLLAALESMARERTANTGIEVSGMAAGPRRRLSRPVEDAAFRIGREAVVNAVRHAEARRIEIHAEFGATTLRLEVRDDGRGFTLEEGEEAGRRGHFGLSGARERARAMGGHCDFRPRPGGGTIVELELPLKAP